MKSHSPRFLALVTKAKKHIKEITPKDLKKLLNSRKPFHLIDVREEKEWLSGHINSAIHLSKGTIERDIEKIIADQNSPIIVYCSGGFRSALVAESLLNMGYSDVYSLEFGLQGWKDEDCPLENIKI